MPALGRYALTLPGEVQRDLEHAASAGFGRVRDPEQLLGERPGGAALASFGEELLARIRRDGMVLVRAASLERRFWRVGFAALGLSIAEPILRYGLLYSVHDRGGSFEESAIPVSQTRSATGFHTDSSAWNCIPGIVGLLCERPSPDGGASRVSDAHRACAWLRSREPVVFEQLCRPFLRDLVTPGVERSPEARRRNRFPVVELDPTFQLRYMRYWIEKGHERLGEPLSPEARRAFDALDAALEHPEWSLRFRLDAGDVLLLDNRRFAHGREAYATVPEGGRLLWRLWLDECWRGRTPTPPLTTSAEG